MESTQGKYDFLISVLTPLHKKILTLQEDSDSLIKCIRELMEYIGPHDYKAKTALSVLIQMLSKVNPNSEEINTQCLILGSKKETLKILTDFHNKIKPDELIPHLWSINTNSFL